MVAEGILGDPLRDAETLLSFIKMEDGLLTPNQVRAPKGFFCTRSLIRIGWSRFFGLVFYSRTFRTV